MAPSSGSTRQRTPSRRRSRSAGARPASRSDSAASGWRTAATARCPGSIRSVNKVVQTIRVGGSPQAIAVGNGRVWVSVQTALFGPGIQAGVLRVASIGIDSLDPAIGYTFDAWAIQYVTCANLLNYPDRPAPEGSRLVPEVAAAMPSALGRRQELHVHDQARLPLLAAVERSRHRADLQVLDRARAEPQDPRRPGEELRRRHRRRASLRGRQGEAHLRHHRPREHPDRPADGCLPGHRLTARAASLLPRPARHPSRGDRREHRFPRRDRTTSPRTDPNRARC